MKMSEIELSENTALDCSDRTSPSSVRWE